MATFNNTMEVFKLLPKTNCRQCNKPTCLAFAADVFQGRKSLEDCPFVAHEIIQKFGARQDTFESKFETDYQERIDRLKKELAAVDFVQKAEKLGGRYHNNRLTIKIMGKDFSVDPLGNISTDIHVNTWLTPVVYNYIAKGAGKPLTGKWTAFRELPSAKNWSHFFEHQCVKPLKEVADTYPDFFENIIELFNGKKINNHYDADISLMIRPLPRLPMLICYNHPEDGIASDLNLFFDSTADENLPVEDIYSLGTGFVMMLKKLAMNHG